MDLISLEINSHTYMSDPKTSEKNSQELIWIDN